MDTRNDEVTTEEMEDRSMGTVEVSGVPVSFQAVFQRINRRLAGAQQALRITRSDRWRSDLGEYYIVDFNRHTIVATHVYPEALARELGVLQPWESCRA